MSGSGEKLCIIFATCKANTTLKCKTEFFCFNMTAGPRFSAPSVSPTPCYHGERWTWGLPDWFRIPDLPLTSRMGLSSHFPSLGLGFPI